MRRCLPLLIVCLLLAACSGSPERTLVTIQEPAYSLAEADKLPKGLRVPLRLERGYLFVNGTVDGQDAGAMMLDTGSTLNIIDRGVVGRVGLEQIGVGRTRGVAGTQSITFHRVASLAIAGVDLGVENAASLSMNKLMGSSGKTPGGIVGSVSLLPHPFTIDYTKTELVIYNRSTFVAPKAAAKSRLLFYGRLPAVRATLANGREVLLIIDTGADNAISLPMEVAKWPGVLATGATGAGITRGVGGQIKTQRGWLKSVGVFGFDLQGVPVTFEPQAHKPGRNGLPVGRIGGVVLKGFRMTFDARESNLWVSFTGETEE